jgi:hypothetical protein
MVAVVALSLAGCAPRNPSKYGVNGEHGAPAADLMKQAGFKWIRLFVGWDDMQPYGYPLDPEKAAALDGTVNEWARRGFSISMTFTRTTPEWAKDPNQAQPCASHPKYRRPAEPYMFGDFAWLMAKRYGDRVAAFEVYNEPEKDCRFPGSAADFRRLILAPGFDAIRSAQPNAIILGPAMATPSEYEEYYTYPKDGKRYLLRPVAALNMHSYGDVAQMKDRLDDASKWRKCMEPAVSSYCVDKFWMTEFGFQNGDADDAAVKVFKHCDAITNCQHIFYFAATYDDVGGVGKTALVDPTTGVPRDKYWKVKDYILGREAPLP